MKTSITLSFLRQKNTFFTAAIVIGLIFAITGCGSTIKQRKFPSNITPEINNVTTSVTAIPPGDAYKTVIVLEAEGLASTDKCEWDVPSAKFVVSESDLTEIAEPDACMVYATFPGAGPAHGSVRAFNGYNYSQWKDFLVGYDPPTRSVSLTRNPYVQNCAQTSLEIIWHTDIDSVGIVGLGTTPDAEEIFAVESASGTEHTASFSGLTEGTTYYYKVYADGVRLAYGDTAHTNPDGEAAFVFAVLGDSGAGGDIQHDVADVMEFMNPDFILHTGDVVYQTGAAEDYPAKFFDPYQNLIKFVCMYPTLGNHDQKTDNGAPYLDVFHLPDNGSPDPQDWETYYSFTYGDALFMSLHSQSDVYPAGLFEEGSRQREWFESTVSASDKKWKIVFFHRPPYSVGRYAPGDDNMQQYAAPLFDQYNIDLVLAGHEHNYQRFYPIRNHQKSDDGPLYIVTGGGGMFLYGQEVDDDERLAVFAAEYHAVKITVDGDTLTGEAIARDYRTIDTFSITKK
ncbi:MAG: metallophosphoesterase family protein [bacterium]